MPAPLARRTPTDVEPIEQLVESARRLRKRTAERRGLGAELARKLGVERAQVSRFKAGKEAFPAGKLGGLYALLARVSVGAG
jgi:transcriptional regulator with XRE-family HTH domain